MNLISSKEVLALDIGRRFIKALVMRKGKSGIEVINASLVKIEFTAEGREEERKASVLEAISQALAEFGKRPQRVAVSCPAEVVFPRLIKLPPVAKGKLKQIVQYETQQQIPFSLEDVIWDYHLLSRPEKTEMSALILAVKKEIVEDILNIISPLKLDVEFLDFTPLSIYNTLCFNGEIMDKAMAIIDIGARSTDIIMVEDREITMVRTIPLGGDSLTQAIMRSSGVIFDDAEKIKERDAFIPGAGEISTEENRKLFLALQPVLEELLDEVRRSIGYYRSQLRGANIESVLLTGGGSQFKNMDRFVEENLRIKVTKISPFTRARAPQGILSKFHEPSVFSVAVGLGLRLLGETRININLLPNRVLERIEFKKKEPLLIISFILILLTIMLYAASSRQKVLREELTLKALDDVIADYSSLDVVLKPKEAEKEKLLTHLAHFEKISKERAFLLDILNEIIYLIPDGVILESFSPPIKERGREQAMHRPDAAGESGELLGRRAGGERTVEGIRREKGIRLEGVSPSFAIISDFISRLEASPLFKKIEVDPSSGQLVKLDNKEFVRFTLLIETTEGF